MITANPEVTYHEITEDDEFLVLACDGDSRVLHIIHYIILTAPSQVSGIV